MVIIIIAIYSRFFRFKDSWFAYDMYCNSLALFFEVRLRAGVLTWQCASEMQAWPPSAKGISSITNKRKVLSSPLFIRAAALDSDSRKWINIDTHKYWTVLRTSTISRLFIFQVSITYSITIKFNVQFSRAEILSVDHCNERIKEKWFPSCSRRVDKPREASIRSRNRRCNFFFSRFYF